MTAPSQSTKREQRREQIIALTWRLIAREGLRAANMRAIAAEAGYANGALAYYFSGKEDLIRAAFEYVLAQTAARIERVTTGLSGLHALEKFCDEVIPHDEEQLLEARIVLPFWESALHEPVFARLHEEAMVAWRAQIRRHLREAQKLGEVPPLSARRTAIDAERILSIMMGAQVLGVLSGDVHTSAMQKAVVQSFLEGLRKR